MRPLSPSPQPPSRPRHRPRAKRARGPTRPVKARQQRLDVVRPERPAELGAGLLLEQPHRMLPREEHGPLAHGPAPVEALVDLGRRGRLRGDLVWRAGLLVERLEVRQDQQTRPDESRSRASADRVGWCTHRGRGRPGLSGVGTHGLRRARRSALPGERYRTLRNRGDRAQEEHTEDPDSAHRSVARGIGRGDRGPQSSRPRRWCRLTSHSHHTHIAGMIRYCPGLGRSRVVPSPADARGPVETGLSKGCSSCSATWL